MWRPAWAAASACPYEEARATEFPHSAPTRYEITEQTCPGQSWGLGKKLVKRCTQARRLSFERRQRSPANQLAKVPVLHRYVKLLVFPASDRNGKVAELFLNP